MDKYKFKSTVFLVFLLVSLFINGVLIYMLIDVNNNDANIETTIKEDNRKYLVSEAMKVYEEVYDILNKEDGNFFINDYDSKVKECVLINFNGMENYFTVKAMGELSKELTFDGGSYYDCNNYLKDHLSYGLFGIIHQRVRDLKYVASDGNTLVVSGQLEYDGTVNSDADPLYMIFKYENNKWLIDLFE